MDNNQLAEKLTLWIKERVTAAGCKGTLLGMSGGIDSAVVAVLCQRAFPQNTLIINLPCYSNPRDQEHAKLVADKFSIPYNVITLDGIYDNFLKILPQDKTEAGADHLAKSNLKVRLRMVTLYYHANRLKYMVVGSSNRSELSIGYFTKWGDGGVDIMPIGNLVKKQVVELAQYLGIPQEIIDKPPSAGLWPGQTDEGEMGLTYKDLDLYLTTGRAGEQVKSRIETMMAKAQHKRTLPPLLDC
ncbi:MAG: NAD(+) synthase [Dehalococcoidales bacterium]|nr:NAD(+) synthase [Dehalococcoidales bacterium]